MLELSIPMRFVMGRAAAEAIAMRTRQIRVEHVFLGLLKLAEINADSLGSGKENAAAIKQETDEVKAGFSEKNVETSSTRALLRRALHDDSATPLDDDEEIKMASLLAIANSLAEKEKLREIRASLVLKAIFDNPPPLIAELCHLHGSKPLKEAAKQYPGVKPGAEPGKIPGREFIPELTARVRKMRCVLLEKIFGQDHAVHTFAEGVFNSELLAYADEKRKRPRAIFVFAGPPGVGKTFLAEQAAEALGLMQHRSAVPAIGRCLDSPVSNLRKSAVIALDRIGDRSVYSLLLTVREDPDAQVRKLTAQLLEKLARARAV